jgi:hypothetical protein
MPENAYGLVELVFTFGLIIAVGVWQLWSIEKTRKRMRDDAARRKETD